MMMVAASSLTKINRKRSYFGSRLLDDRIASNLNLCSWYVRLKISVHFNLHDVRWDAMKSDPPRGTWRCVMIRGPVITNGLFQLYLSQSVSPVAIIPLIYNRNQLFANTEPSVTGHFSSVIDELAYIQILMTCCVYIALLSLRLAP